MEMKRRIFLKGVVLSIVGSAFLPAILRFFKKEARLQYPGPVKQLDPENINKEASWKG
jgi:hypothetical protein